MNLIVSQINYWLINENNFRIVLSENGSIDDNGILMHLTHNEGKSVVAESFIKTLKSKIDKK